MVNKQQILLDSVRKLAALGISDKEIILNLKDVGISADEARRLIDEARHGAQPGHGRHAPAHQAAQKRPEAEKRERALLIGAGAEPESELYEGVEEALEKKPPEPAAAKQAAEESAAHAPAKPATAASARAAASLKAARQELKEKRAAPTAGVDVGELWRRGVLAAADAKLAEMEKIRKDIERVIDEKVHSEVSGIIEREISKTKVVFDSQKTLFMEKINSELVARGKEIGDVVDAKLGELSSTSKELQDTLDLVVEEKEIAKDMAGEAEAKLADTDRTRTALVADVNKALLESRGQMEDFLAESRKRVDDADSRINRTLELSSKITEGMLKDAEAKIEALQLRKTETLEAEVKARLDKLDEIGRRIKPEIIEARIAKLDALVDDAKQAIADYRVKLQKQNAAFVQKTSRENDALVQKLSSEHEAFMQKLSRDAETQVADAFELQKVAWDKVIKDKAAEIGEIPKKLDLKSIETAKEELDIFKDQFVKVVKKNVTAFNKAKKAWAARMEANDKAMQAHLKAIDEKMKELNEFEKNFAAEMGLVVEKLATPKGKPAGKGRAR